jgi:hypothetical protein
MSSCQTRILALIFLLAIGPGVRADDPIDNPIATFYSEAEGYPAWTDAIPWTKVINMKTYEKGKTAFEKFTLALKELSEGGGVLYYPAGTYDFSTMPPGRGLMLTQNVVIRGEAPAKRTLAANGTLKLGTKFIFPFRKRLGGRVPADWNFIGLALAEGYLDKGTDRVGIAWVHLVGASVFFGPDMDWGETWGTAGNPASHKIRKGWDKRKPDGTHPFDVFAGAKKFKGSGKGRLVFGCVLEDAAVLNDFHDPGYGPNGFSMQHHTARIAVYGGRIFVANNLLPRSKKNFTYRQKTSRGTATVLYDYANTGGIDINKELLKPVRDDGACPGYFEEGIVVRDNYVFNHGHTGFNVSGKWVTISGNNNDRAFLRQGDQVYDVRPWVLTLDGYKVAGPYLDNRSRAFDLAGRNLWIDGNRFTNTGSAPGNDGEGIAGRGKDGTPIYSWAITHNTHKRGTGAAGSMGGSDADCHGLLIAWNQTPGWVGSSVTTEGTKMTDCAFVANKCLRVLPDKKAVAGLGLPAPLTANPPGKPAPPTKVMAEVYQGDAVKITWTAAADKAVGFRVERRVGDGKWQVIAYRPPRLQGDPDNPQAWVDFMAPPGKVLTYRVVAIDADDNDKGASAPTAAVKLERK